MLKLVKFLKDFLLFIPLTFVFRPFSKFFLFISYYNKLAAWIIRNKKNLLLNDFYSPLRNYQKRYTLYKTIADHFHLQQKPIIYLEFGVASGASFKWWLTENKNPNSMFRGFDTFEGLPEDWGTFYAKGSMQAPLPDFNDNRALFLKGLFQDTLPSFLKIEQEKLSSGDTIRVIHMDADLYSSTIFSLYQLYPFLKKGDLIFFDEFNVAMHEFKAFYEFTQCSYIKLKPVAAVNNYYQVAFEVA